MQKTRYKTNVVRPKEFLLTELNTRRLRTRAILVIPPIVSPRSSSFLLNKLTDDEASDLRFMALTVTVTHIRKNVSSELDTDNMKQCYLSPPYSPVLSLFHGIPATVMG